MYSFDKKPLKEPQKKEPQQQTRGRDPYAGIRQMSSLMGNQAMLAMLRSQRQEGVGGTPFFEEIRAKFGQARKPEDPAQKPARQSTGGVSLPDHLREKFEKKSGLPMDDVRVHYNSDKPEQLDALAYTQGTEVFVGPGQEEHLEHELGHVVQQKQGVVHPTGQIGGKLLNDSPELEAATDKPTHKIEGSMTSKNMGAVIQRCPKPDTDTTTNNQVPPPPPPPPPPVPGAYRMPETPAHIAAAEQYLSSAFQSIQFAASRIHSGVNDRDELLKPGKTVFGQNENVSSERYDQVLSIVENWDRYGMPNGISELYRGDSTAGLKAICEQNGIVIPEQIQEQTAEQMPEQTNDPFVDALTNQTIEFDRFVSTSTAKDSQFTAQKVNWIFSGDIEGNGRILGDLYQSEKEVTLPPGVKVLITSVEPPNDNKESKKDGYTLHAQIIGRSDVGTYIENAKKAVDVIQPAKPVQPDKPTQPVKE